MAVFEEAIKFVLDNEGGFVDNPNDPGGATNKGISLRFLRSLTEANLKRYGIFKEGALLTPMDIEELTPAQIELVYKGDFWEKVPFNHIIEQQLCNYVFDMAVLHGFSPAFKLVQRGIWAVQHTYGFIKADGILGAETIDELNSYGTAFLSVLIAMRASYCRLLAEINPKNMEFLDGWLKRCYRV